MSEEQAEYRTKDDRPATEGGTQEFKNLLEVSEWLSQQGWKVSKSTLYKHAKDGRLRPSGNGAFPVLTVEKYAIQWLHKKSDAEKVKAEKQTQALRNVEKRVKEAQAKHIEMKNAILEGKYILRESFDRELAGRAASLQGRLNLVVQTKAMRWIAICKGNHALTKDFLQSVTDDLIETLNDFVMAGEQQIEFVEETGKEEGEKVRR